jgi:sialate O-acetylesterase
MSYIKIVRSACVLTLAITASVMPNVTMSKIFNSNMVLQHGMPLPVWGTATAGEHVRIQFNGQTKDTAAGSNGAWKIILDSMAISATPLQMTITGANTVTLTNILIGEVWLAGGQSNISFSMNTIGGPNVDSARAANYPNLRFMNFREVGIWQVCTPTTALNFSPLGYYFGRNIQVNLNVPVGVILSAQDGTDIEFWMDSASIAADPLIANDAVAGTLYRNFIAPLVTYGIRGVIWYQGENNANEPYPNHPNWSASHYKGRFQALIQGWRRVWGQGNFPFFYVQICSVNGLQTNPVPPTDTWHMIRDAQRLNLSVPNTGMAVIIDLAENARVGEAELHPWNKWDVGKRLWLIASSLCYGNTTTVYSGPMYTSMSIKGNKINLYFKHTDGGLVAKGGGSLKGFAIAGSNNNWVWGTATIDHDTIAVTSPQVAAPTQVIYACAHYPLFNLYNGAGLPASPFSTNPADIVAVSQLPGRSPAPTSVGAMSGITSIKVFDLAGHCLGTITSNNTKALSTSAITLKSLAGQDRFAKGIYLMQLQSSDKSVVTLKILRP